MKVRPLLANIKKAVINVFFCAVIADFVSSVTSGDGQYKAVAYIHSVYRRTTDVHCIQH